MPALFGKSIEHLTARDITELQINDVRKATHLEYKAELPGNADKERKEFVQDVAAIANAGGGWLMFGIQEEKNNHKSSGKISSIPGIESTMPDDEILRLENMCRIEIELNLPRFDNQRS